jgi:integrase
MATIKLRYVNEFRDRHGKPRYYFRKGATCEPLPGTPGSPVFSEAYDLLLAAHAPHAIVRRGRMAAQDGTLAWVIEQYKLSDAWKKELRPSTKEVYDRHFDWLRKRCGSGDLRTLTERHVRAMRNELKDRTTVADAVVGKIGMLWRYAKEHLGMDDLGPNPTREVADLHGASKPHPAWPDDLCEKFEQLGNRGLVRAYFLLRYTGQRRSDVVKMERKHFDGSAISVVQQKTGTHVWIPCHQRLREHLRATGYEQPYLLQSSLGKPLRETSLTNMVITACKALGFPGFSPHGLRHRAGAALAESGCSMDEIMSILGHATEGEARGYVTQANKRVMAASAMEKWDRMSNKSYKPED